MNRYIDKWTYRETDRKQEMTEKSRRGKTLKDIDIESDRHKGSLEQL